MMGQVLDAALVGLLVAVSVLYALYTLGPIRLKRRMLEWLIRCFGLRVYAWLSPRMGGCNACADGKRQHYAPRKLAARVFGGSHQRQKDHSGRR